MRYVTIFAIPYTILLVFLMIFGSKDLIISKLGRLTIHWTCLIASFVFHTRWKYSFDVILALWLLTLGVFDTWMLASMGKYLAITGDASELIGSDTTTLCFIIFISLHNNQKYCLGIFTPIYLLINIAMLLSVYEDIEETGMGKKKVNKAINVIVRFTFIAVGCLFAQYLVVIQETELFLKSRITKMQQKQLVNVFNNQPDGIILTRAAIDDRANPPAPIDEKEIHFELCNQAVTKILGFTPRMNGTCPDSILKNSGAKMLNKPMFLELSVD